MVLSAEDTQEILEQARLRREQRPPADGYEEPPELTAEDEKILDRIWREEAERNPRHTPQGTMTDEETLEFFGLK